MIKFADGDKKLLKYFPISVVRLNDDVALRNRR